MAYNHIIKKKSLGSVVSGGKTLALSAATEIGYWTPPSSMAGKLKSPLGKAIQSSPGENSIMGRRSLRSVGGVETSIIFNLRSS